MRGGKNKTIGCTVGAALAFAIVAFSSIPSSHAQTPAQDKSESSAREHLIRSRQVQETLPVCFECHGEGGVSRVPSYPTIAGQKAGYLRRQLMAFKRAARDGRPLQENAISRTDPVMVHMADALADEMIAPVAEALSKLACDGGKENDKPRATLPRSAEFPEAAAACVGCHGVNGISHQPDVPNLAGQQRSYLRRQLLLVRETAWGAMPRASEGWRSHPIMEQRVARLSIADIDAIASYFSALPCDGAPNPPPTPSN